MERQPIIAGNWKMHMTVAEGMSLAKAITDWYSTYPARDGVEVVVGPSFTSLSAIQGALEGSGVALSAQNCHWAEKGAYTGEAAPSQLADVGCKYVIVGHSERRTLFGETDEGVGRKARSLIDVGLIPIICVGETLEQRESGTTEKVVSRQVQAALDPLTADEVARSVVAYEPVWAIGTGRTASPGQAQEMHDTIRRRIGGQHGADAAKKVRILYGGSVKPDNVGPLMTQPDIDGALVGGASLKAQSFNQLIGFRERMS